MVIESCRNIAFTVTVAADDHLAEEVCGPIGDAVIDELIERACAAGAGKRDAVARHQAAVCGGDSRLVEIRPASLTCRLRCPSSWLPHPSPDRSGTTDGVSFRLLADP